MTILYVRRKIAITSSCLDKKRAALVEAVQRWQGGTCMPAFWTLLHSQRHILSVLHGSASGDDGQVVRARALLKNA
jgi:hypothetical protein